MRRYVTTLLCAAALTGLSFWGYYVLEQSGEPHLLAEIAFAPAMPAFFATVVCCGSAHEGIAASPGVFVFTATFVLWTVVVHVMSWLRT